MKSWVHFNVLRSSLGNFVEFAEREKELIIHICFSSLSSLLLERGQLRLAVQTSLPSVVV